MVFWANIEQLFRHFQHFFKIRTPGYDSRGLKKIKSPTFPTHSRIPYFPLSVTYRNISKMSPWAYIFQRPFLRGLFLEGLIFGGAYLQKGNLRFKIDWTSLIVGSKLTVFALFYFVFEGSFPGTSPRGAYI